MTLKITDTAITSDQISDRAWLEDGLWFVTGYTRRVFDRNEAITAMSLAELPTSGLAPTDPEYAALAAAWREELGLPTLDAGLAQEQSRTSSESAEPDQPRTSPEPNQSAAYPAPGSEIPGQPGYVVGTCSHRIAGSEWRAGFRTCERCPDDVHPDVVDEPDQPRTSPGPAEPSAALMNQFRQTFADRTSSGEASD